jgi:hypothetical protein
MSATGLSSTLIVKVCMFCGRGRDGTTLSATMPNVVLAISLERAMSYLSEENIEKRCVRKVFSNCSIEISSMSFFSGCSFALFIRTSREYLAVRNVYDLTHTSFATVVATATRYGERLKTILISLAPCQTNAFIYTFILLRILEVLCETCCSN